jgi:hypothetical protein
MSDPRSDRSKTATRKRPDPNGERPKVDSPEQRKQAQYRQNQRTRPDKHGGSGAGRQQGGSGTGRERG